MAIPPDRAVAGVVLADQVKSLDWRARKAERACALPPSAADDVLATPSVLLER